MTETKTRVLFDISKAISLWSQDIPLSEVARKLGTTKSALTGFAYRNRDRFPMKDPAKAQRKQRGAERAEKAPQSVMRPVAVSVPRLKLVRAVETPPEPKLKYLYQLERGECKFPIDGSKSEMRFCCHEQKEGKAYCQFHHKISLSPGTASERAAHRVSKRNLE